MTRPLYTWSATRKQLLIQGHSDTMVTLDQVYGPKMTNLCKALAITDLTVTYNDDDGETSANMIKRMGALYIPETTINLVDYREDYEDA